ncbi:MAG: YjfB family protein [Lachnospiraceae bacterium]|nr:YjfB family protein [Lachnospiraceae bacterium]
MDIPGLSMALSQANLLQQVGIAVLDKQLDLGKEVGAELMEIMDSASMELSVNPAVGGNFDMRI